jgi:hypothetical protein
MLAHKITYDKVYLLSSIRTRRGGGGRFEWVCGDVRMLGSGPVSGNEVGAEVLERLRLRLKRSASASPGGHCLSVLTLDPTNPFRSNPRRCSCYVAPLDLFDSTNKLNPGRLPQGEKTWIFSGARGNGKTYQLHWPFGISLGHHAFSRPTKWANSLAVPSSKMGVAGSTPNRYSRRHANTLM